MKFDIVKIKESMTIQQLLIRRGYDIGTNKKMICSPLRKEKTPSFSIRDEGRKFHDFGSGADGDIIDLEMEITGCDKATAIRNLAALCNVMGEEDIYDLPPIPPPPKPSVKKLGEIIAPEMLKALRLNLKRDLEHGNRSCCRTLAWLPPEDQLKVLRKGFLGSNNKGELVYLMRRGIKARTIPESSRGDRWTQGKAAENAFYSWRPEDLSAEGSTTLLFTEGESDSMAAIARWGDSIRVLGCLSAGIAPPMEILYAAARHCDKAVIAFDGDTAGREGSKSLVILLQRLFPKMKIWNYRTPDGQDLKKMFLDGSIGIIDDLLAS
jgi:hypothetical protein